MAEEKDELELRELRTKELIDKKLATHDTVQFRFMAFGAAIFALLGWLGFDKIVEIKLNELGREKIEEKYAESVALVNEIERLRSIYEEPDMQCKTFEGVANNRNQAILTCPVGYIATGGGASVKPTGNLKISAPFKNGWQCKFTGELKSKKCFVRCCRVAAIQGAPDEVDSAAQQIVQPDA